MAKMVKCVLGSEKFLVLTSVFSIVEKVGLFFNSLFAVRLWFYRSNIYLISTIDIYISRIFDFTTFIKTELPDREFSVKKIYFLKQKHKYIKTTNHLSRISNEPTKTVQRV